MYCPFSLQPWGLRKNCTFVGTCSQLGKKTLYFSEMKCGKDWSRGQPFGHFNFGSTIVLLYEIPKSEMPDESGPENGSIFQSGDRLKVGQSLVVKQQQQTFVTDL